MALICNQGVCIHLTFISILNDNIDVIRSSTDHEAQQVITFYDMLVKRQKLGVPIDLMDWEYLEDLWQDFSVTVTGHSIIRNHMNSKLHKIK